MNRNHRRGFTLVELLVALAIGAILIGITYTIFVTQRRSHVVQEQVGEMQQNGRVAADLLTRAIKGIGNNVVRNDDPALAQRQLIYAGPYELIFNANQDDNLPPVAVGGTAGTTIAGKYAPTITFGTVPVGAGAETYRYSLDRDEDGDVDADDRVDGRHYTLYCEVFSGAGRVRRDVVATDLNITDPTGAPRALFAYWGDFANPAANTNQPWGSTAPVSVAGRELDQMVHTIDVRVTTETHAPDPQYAAALSTSGGYRQTLVQSNVTPRNLWDCPVLTYVQAAPQPWTAVDGLPLLYRFPVTYQGTAYNNKNVTFLLAGPGTAGGLVTLDAATVPSAAGEARAQINWPSAAIFATPGNELYDRLSRGLSLVYTLTATIEPLNTSMGSCGAQSTVMTFQIDPAPATKVVAIAGPTVSPLLTCGDNRHPQVVFQAQCEHSGSSLPAPLANGDQILFTTSVTAGAGADFGTLDVTQATNPLDTVSTQPQAKQVTYSLPTTWPTGPLTQWDTSPVGHFEAYVVATLNGTSDSRPITLVPTPSSIPANAYVAGIGTQPFSDCVPSTKTDSFVIHDCFGNQVWSMPAGFAGHNYQLHSMLKDDASTLGALSPAPPDPPTFDLGTHKWKLSFTNENCAVGPSSTGQQATGHYGVWVTDNGSTVARMPAPPSTWDPAASSPTGLPLTVQSCAGTCDVTFADVLTPCLKTTTVTVTGCGLAGQTAAISLGVSGGPGAGYLRDPATGRTAAVGQNLDMIFSATSTIVVELHISQGRPATSTSPATTFTVTSTYTRGQRWSCSGSATVSTACNSILVEHRNQVTRQWETVANETGESCLTKIDELRVTVQDCQLPSVTSLAQAVTFYLQSSDGTYLDYEMVDLTSADGVTWISASLPVERADTPQPGNRRLSYPAGKAVRLVAAYRDPNDSLDDFDPTHPTPRTDQATCRKVVSLTTPIPVCFPNAITSGGGGGWNGNFKIHWGDVVIRGDVKLASSPKFLEKVDTATVDGADYRTGSDNSDRFFDIYVGKNAGDLTGGNYKDNNNTPIPNSFPNTLGRPFMTGGEGYSQVNNGKSYGNYYRNISNAKITSMMRELDYDLMKSLAIERDVYWYTERATGKIRQSPTTPAHSIGTVLSFPQPTPLLYAGEFIFIDTYEDTPGSGTVSKNGGQINSDAAAGLLPVHSVNAINTKGIIYIAGTLDWGGSGSGATVSAKSPPQYDIPRPYQHNLATPAPVEDDLPVRPNPDPVAAPTINVTLSDININGALYLEGKFTGNGSPKIYGAVSAEQGFESGGNAEVWYNYNLNVSEQNNTLCVNCCTLRVTSPSATVPECGTVGLSGLFNAGRVDWFSEDSGVASVASTGLRTAAVRAVSLGTTKITGRDGNNCTSLIDLAVTPLSVAPMNSTVSLSATPLCQTLQVDAPLGNVIDWTSSDPATVNVIPLADTRTATVCGVGLGRATVTPTIRGGTCLGPGATVEVIP
jgi:prepilin-type N-terminal cleavage/methylation domain-containing protein